MSAWDETPLEGTVAKNAPANAWNATPIDDSNEWDNNSPITQSMDAPKPKKDSGFHPLDNIARGFPALVNYFDIGIPKPGGAAQGRVIGATDPIVGAAQLAVNAIPGLNTFAPDVNNFVKDRADNYNAAREAAGRSGMDAARMVGNIASPVNLLAGQGVSKLISPAINSTLLAAKPLAQATLTSAAQGAANGLLSPVENGGNTFASDKALQTFGGAAMGAAMPSAGQALSKVVAPPVSAASRTLLDAGINLTPGQLIGGSAKRIEDAMTSIPIIGDMIRNSQRSTFQDLNAAAINRGLAPIGDKLPSGMTGSDAITYASNSLSKAYENVLNKIGAVPVDSTFNQSLAKINSMAQNLPPQYAQQIDSIIKNEVASRINPQGYMTSDGLKAAESKLGEISRGYARGDYDQQVVSDAVQEVQSQLRQMLQRQASPELAAELKAVNTGYANFLRPMKAAASQRADEGTFTPEQLNASVRALDTSKMKRQYAQGNALMQDLSDAALSQMGNKVPDSGTPLRHMVGLGVTGGLGLRAGHGAPAVESIAPYAPLMAGAGLLGAGATGAAYSGAGKTLINNLVAGGGAQRQQAAEFVKKSTPFLTPGVVGNAGLLGYFAN